MNHDIAKEFERLKQLLLQATPVWIDGIDFFAFNFGDGSQENSMAGSDSKITSAAGSAIIDRDTKQWRFGEPHMPIVNVSHVLKYDQARAELTFMEVKRLVERK